LTIGSHALWRFAFAFAEVKMAKAAGNPKMQNKSKPTEIEKLGPDFKGIIAGTLVAVTVAASVIGGAVEVADFVHSEKTETKQLIKDYRDTDQIAANIIKKSANKQATGFYILKLALQDEKNAADELIKDTSALGKSLGLQENRAFRSSQYQAMIDDVQYRLDELEAKGQRPFDNLGKRSAVEHKQVDAEQAGLKL
jgi:hypothetical protein